MHNTVSSLGGAKDYMTTQGLGDTQGNPASIENSSIDASQLEAKLVDNTNKLPGTNATVHSEQQISPAIECNSFVVAQQPELAHPPQIHIS